LNRCSNVLIDSILNAGGFLRLII